MEKMRLQKYISICGTASRRKAEEMIRLGRVCVNNELVSEMGVLVDPSCDIVLVDGEKISPEKSKVYIMLNKPVGYVSTSDDQFGRSKVTDLVKILNIRLYPVGRLDYDTSGLLLLTNDGDFSYLITHPKHKIEKIYLAKASGNISIQEITEFESGLTIDGYKTHNAKMSIIDKGDGFTIAEVTIHEGKNRQVRKMFDAINHPIIHLKRIAINGLRLGDLKDGDFRHLEIEEIRSLVDSSVNHSSSS
jgi:23S rRNA pseudouridine2605 synthase